MLHDKDTGYILEVDMDYPESLHDYHDSYPMAPETKLIETINLSPYSKKSHNRLYTSPKASDCYKLVNTLENKRNYIVIDENLRFYLQSGLVLVRIHKAVKYKKTTLVGR